MGVHVHLAVLADRVSDAAWRDIYARARRVATQWTPRPLTSAWRQIGSVRVAQYGLDIEIPQGLHIVGDVGSLTTGESFIFPARLGRTKPPVASDHDVLVAVAWRIDPEATRSLPCHHLLGAKTQGLPYHVLIVALGLLVEHSLPGTAVVYGDISTRDGEQAQRGLAWILGEDVAPPVVVDVERVRRRLAGGVTAAMLELTIRSLFKRARHAFRAMVYASRYGMDRMLREGHQLMDAVARFRCAVSTAEERNNEQLQAAIGEAIKSALTTPSTTQLSRGQVGTWIKRLPH